MGSLLQDPRYGLRSRADIVWFAAREGVPSDHRSTHTTKRGGISFHTIIARSTRSSRRSSRAPARASSKVAYGADVNDESIVPCRMIPFSLYMRRPSTQRNPVRRKPRIPLLTWTAVARLELALLSCEPLMQAFGDRLVEPAKRHTKKRKLVPAVGATRGTPQPRPATPVAGMPALRAEGCFVHEPGLLWRRRCNRSRLSRGELRTCCGLRLSTASRDDSRRSVHPARTGPRRCLLLLGHLRHERLGRQQERGDRRRVLQR
jgi:hypothetical protein